MKLCLTRVGLFSTSYCIASSFVVQCKKTFGVTMGRNLTVGILTLGCRVNQYESEALARILTEKGHTVCEFLRGLDFYVINTCAVTAESERKSRQMIRRASKLNQAAKIIVMGCYSQLFPSDALRLPNVVYVCGNRNKLTAAGIIDMVSSGLDVTPHANVGVLDGVKCESMTVTTSDHTRAYVKTSDGCDNNCSYCIIRTARGAVSSRSIDDICREVRGLGDNGYREVVLTGIETASFGRDTGEKLSDLIAAVARDENIRRIRLGSMEPSRLTKDFIDVLVSVGKFMPSFHLSLQSGSDRVLNAMRRKYNSRQVLESVRYIRSVMPTATFTCDMIVGFPGETDADFNDSCALAREIGFLHMHVFPFSPRRGTDAATMSDQIPENVKNERAACLIAIGDELHDAVMRDQVGRTAQVLFETPHGGYNIGHTPEMTEVYVRGDKSLQGVIADVRIDRYEGGKLYGGII